MNSSPATANPATQTRDDLQAQARAWVCDFAGGRPTADDAEAIRRWRALSPAHEQAWIGACREWRQTGEATRSFAAMHPQAGRMRAPRMGRREWFGLAASAVGALGVIAIVRPPLGLWPSWSELEADYRTVTGEQREVELDAQTRLSLNTQTSVAVEALGGALRVKLITGEAALSARATPCEVLAGSASVRATVGDIEVRFMTPDQVRVRCNTGTAHLRHPMRGLALQAGQEVVYDLNGVQAPVRTAAASEWREGLVVFRDLPLAEVVNEINRYRPGRVVLMNEALASQRLSANFSIDDLDEAINHIQRMYKVTVHRWGDVVLIA